MRDALPNATYLGFTGTPIESADVNTPAVFGNYVDIYDIAQAVFEGKGMIVAMSRRIAVKLYNAIVQIKPEWHSYEYGRQR